MNQNTEQKKGSYQKKRRGFSKHSVILALYDWAWLLCSCALILLLNPSGVEKEYRLLEVTKHAGLISACVIGGRIIFGLYGYVWRYGNNYLNIRMILVETLAGFAYFFLHKLLPMAQVMFIRAVSLVTLDLIGALAMRQIYQFLYDASSQDSRMAQFFRILSKLMGLRIEPEDRSKRIGVAIVGAGRVGVGLAEDLARNPNASYIARCFIDIDKEKIGKSINGIPVLSDKDDFSQFNVQEIVFALPDASAERKKELYEFYKSFGYKLKTYDFPTTQNVNGKRALREFDVEELLFRPKVELLDNATRAYYKGKRILISGGGGSIGSELSRQIVTAEPEKLIILDVYENCAYDLQQELKMKYGSSLDLAVEIVTITDRGELEKVFEKHRPDVVIHAAAHKHVPLMETNCCEAVKNNVFGTKNIVEVAEAYGTKKFIMVSTDKAVNPTNVMGATKRMCEMIVLNHRGNMQCSATRFGNVLGSNGSVIPLFKRQISNGGPVTLTDRRIIRYFMTIPEASQLVLTSGAMAKHGELFVLDMGQPIKILDLAENMIRLSGVQGVEIVETGLRPGEKLYEELLVKTEELDKTDNDLIFIERDEKLADNEIHEKLIVLKNACDTEDNENVRAALKLAIPTYRNPEEVNKTAFEAAEMKKVH